MQNVTHSSTRRRTQNGRMFQRNQTHRSHSFHRHGPSAHSPQCKVRMEKRKVLAILVPPISPKQKTIMKMPDEVPLPMTDACPLFVPSLLPSLPFHGSSPPLSFLFFFLSFPPFLFSVFFLCFSFPSFPFSFFSFPLSFFPLCNPRN